jgi:N utilization substance protein A
VRLASKLCGWDIEIMTADELEQQIDRAVAGFSSLDGVEEELAQSLVEQGYLSYDDLEVIEPEALMEMGDLSEEQANHIIRQAELRAEAAELAAAEQRRLQKAQEQQERDRQAGLSEADAAADQQRVDDDTSAGTDDPQADLSGSNHAGSDHDGAEPDEVDRSEDTGELSATLTDERKPAADDGRED